MQNIEINLDLDTFRVAKTITCDIDNAKNHITSHKHTINILSQNVRSINRNMPNFVTLLQRSKISWDILVLSECWLPSAKYIPSLDNYNHVATTSNKSQNEGVVIYYNNRFQASVEEPSVIDANCLLLKFNRDVCILGIYRPPSQNNITKFIDSLNLLLTNLKTFKNIFLCGDININIVPNSADKRSHEYLNLLASHGMLPGHTLPTHGLTCLDHMMLKTNMDVSCFVFETSITDHESVAISCKPKLRPHYINETYSSVNYESLDKEMLTINFQPIIESQDANVSTELLVTRLSAAIKNNTRIVKTNRKELITKPWITKGLLRCMRNRDNLHKKLKRNPDDETIKTTYKRYRNYCNTLLKKAKKRYDKNEIDNAKGNKKQLWDVIKRISGSDKRIDHSSSLLSSNNPDSDINNVNYFFANVGANLANKISNSKPAQSSYCNDHLPNTPPNSMVILPTDEQEIFTLINGLKDKCAVGIDLISGKIVKRYVNLLTSPMTHICNLSIATGVFPELFKIALIKPVYKAGEKHSVNNYRPISILPALSKILERLINKRLIMFLETNNLLSPSQFGFRTGKSANDAVHELVNSIVGSLDDRMKCLTVFLDLAKAFDTVSIPNLLKKLDRLGVRGTPLKLLEDYLTGRKQRVKINDRLSDELTVNFGVPQGSIIGPTLFLVYINDLCQLPLLKGKIITFADDTALFFSGGSWDEVFDTAQLGVNTVSEWLQNNLLTLNVSKTKYVTFAHRANLLPPSTLSISVHTFCSPNPECTCPTLERAVNIKYLGIIIDSHLSFKSHFEMLVPRIRKLIYIFKSLRHSADRKIIKMVYFALCQSLIEYCITTWGGAAKTHLIQVERAQRAILKVGAGLPFRFPTNELYKEWDILTVRQTFILLTVTKKHSQLQFDSKLINNQRRKGRICPSLQFKSSLPQNFFCFLGQFLYNKLNVTLNLYPKTTSYCQKTVKIFLKTLDYQNTENLLTIPK